MHKKSQGGVKTVLTFVQGAKRAIYVYMFAEVVATGVKS